MADAAKAARKVCKSSSFVPGTKVLMADGTTKPIEDITVGDKVLATDPVSGETAAKTVVGTITTQGWKDLVRLSVDTDDIIGPMTGTIVATAGQPIWAPEKGQWLAASAVQTSDRLRDVHGRTVEVATVDPYNRLQRVHNFTVADTHTYYVLVGKAPVLVHNSGCGTADPFSFRRTEALSENASKRNVDELTASMKENGWQGDPISVAKIGDDFYVLDGHHRVAAAKRAGIDVPYRVLPDSEIRVRYRGGADAITTAWAEVGPDKLVNKYRKPGFR